MFKKESLNTQNIPESKDEKIKKVNYLLDKLETSISKLEKSSHPKSIENFQLKSKEFWDSIFHLLLGLKEKSLQMNSPLLKTITDIVLQCICFQQDLLTLCCSFQKPDERGMNIIFSRFKILIKPLATLALSGSEIELRINCIENGINVLCWLFNDYECDIIARTYFESIDFPLNSIMKRKNKGEIEWFKIFKELLENVVEFVVNNGKNGLNWLTSGNNEINELILELGSCYRNNFSPNGMKEEKELELEMEKINNENRDKIRVAVESGEMKKKLKPIKKENNVNKKEYEENSELNYNNIEQKEKKKFSTSTYFHPGARSSLAKDKKEFYEENKNFIIFENYIGLNKEIEKDKLHSGIFLEIVNCINCTFNITKKINKIMILNCENCYIFCEELISDIEMINCTKIRTTCQGHVNLAIVYRSKDIFFFLNEISRKLRIRRSFSSHIMLKINKDQNEDFKEWEDFLLPEQFVFQINKDKKLEIKYIGF